MEELISSMQNPKIKQLAVLQQKSSARRKHGLFVVEGQREIHNCMDSGFSIECIFYCKDICGETSFLANYKSIPLIPVSKYIYEKISYRQGTEGVLAEVKSRYLHLPDLILSKNPLVIILESVEKPGNLGAVLRTADAAGADAVIICDPLTDLYNPNIIRSSIGGIFTTQCVACESDECINWLRLHNIRILTAQLQDSKLYYDTDMTRATAIVMGTESVGLTDKWRKAADEHIRIPMLGKLDSLNVSVSASILLYEAVRQRLKA